MRDIKEEFQGVGKEDRGCVILRRVFAKEH